jgi:uncharacterized membrane protein YedE/YeeE
VSADFSPLPALAGGVLIGIATALLLLVNGRTAGVSGMLAGLVSPIRGDTLWRALFLGGLLLAGALGVLVAPESIAPSSRGLGALALAGLLVGAGTRLSNGCTSGHGICGVARGSLRSIAATCTFVLTGMITVGVLRAWGGAP